MKQTTAFKQLMTILCDEGLSATIEEDYIDVDTEEIGPVFLEFKEDTQHLHLWTCVFLDHPSSAEAHRRVVNELNYASDVARFYLPSNETSVVHAEVAHLVYTRTLTRALVANSLSHFVKEVDYSHHVFAAEGLFHWSQFVPEFWESVDEQSKSIS